MEKPMPNYLPFEERRPSTQYQDMLRTIREQGVQVETKQGQDALAVAGCQMRFPMAQGAAVITERSIRGFVTKAIGELCAFINGARTLDELEAFGCDWWDAWATPAKSNSRGLEAGDLGPGSYGHAFRNFTTNLDDPSEEGYDQLAGIITKLTELPLDRTAVMSPWIPQANHRTADTKSRNTIAPCHGWIHALVFNDKLHLIHNQRSGDTPIGVPSNMAQYTALGLMIEQLTGYEFVEYVHWIQYAHIYVNQLDRVDEMLAREPLPLPTLELTEAGRRVTDIHDFRAEHFALSDYHPHPSIRDIPVLT
ncbi:thymidylate synthase [Conexibacter woesei]|uniref:thymidylate synthase n=1 Tax=Conexibacter woesei TaxID=191495 RepID=UPI0004160F69|nr:thymidylate synthase [Conexibacter woesei]